VVVVLVLLLLLYTLYAYILLLNMLSAPLTANPQRELDFFKSKYYLLGKLVAARTRCCSPPVCRLLCGALFSNESAPAFHMRLQKPMNFDHQFFDFSKSHWHPHFSYGFDMTRSSHNTCDPPR